MMYVTHNFEVKIKAAEKELHMVQTEDEVSIRGKKQVVEKDKLGQP